MAQSLILKIAGLHTSVNELSSVPEGALLKADNINISKDNIAEPRRGFARLAAGFATSTDRTEKSWFYQDKQFAHHGDLNDADSLSYFNSGSWNSVSGTFSAPEGFRMRTLEANQNLYFTSSTGVYKMDAFNATPVLAGAYKALDLQTALSGSSGFLEPNFRVAYRILWGRKDANKNLVLGAPSQRSDVKNTNAGTAEIATLTFPAFGSASQADYVTFENVAGTTYAVWLDLNDNGTVPTGASYASASVKIEVDIATDDSAATVGTAAATAISSSVAGITVTDNLDGTVTLTQTSVGAVANANPRNADASGAGSISASTGTDGVDAFSTNVAVTAAIPAGVTTDWIYQVYRSAQVDNTSLDFEPNDELQLVYEASPSSGQISAKEITFTDNVPDSLRGATIYTAGSQEGLAYQNERPPLAKDMATFRDVTFYANNTSKHRYYLTLLAVDGASGLVADDTISIGGVTYTAKTSETVASAQFKVFTAGSAAQNIKDTSLSLVKVINAHTSSTVYAYYLSGPEDLPGKILLEERGTGGAAFVVTSSVSACWNPAGIPSSGTTETSTNDRFKNGLMWSKPFQPEAVPLVNQVQVGSKDSEILRIIPLREALLIFKEEGIYRLTGFFPNFDVELIDSSARLTGTETPQVLNNQIYCLTDQGVTVVSDSVAVISRPIEEDLQELVAADLDLVKSASFGVSYESERRYYLFLPSSATDTYPTQAFVYNIFTRAWVRHNLSATTGTVYNNRLYLGSATSNYIVQDRKSSTYADYADYGFTTSIIGTDSRTITLNDGLDLLAVGDILFQSSTIFATITAKDAGTSTVTVDTNPGFTEASVDVLKAISVDLKWVPVTLGNPGILKHFHSVQPMFKSDFTGTAYLTFESDLSQFAESVPISGSGNSSWGMFPWGSRPWGGVPFKRSSRQWIPRPKQRCSQLTISLQHAVGYSSWELTGLTVFGTPGSDRTIR